MPSERMEERAIKNAEAFVLQIVVGLFKQQIQPSALRAVALEVLRSIPKKSKGA